MISWVKHDLKAGFLVFLIALPLCLGIAMASGFPPVAGVLTAVVGGLVATFLGSAQLSIKGPAAGLIVIVIGSVMDLGGGDVLLGYRRTLAVGVVAAVIQIIFALAGAATFGIIVSPSVVHGMLAAIGVIIIAKQSHVMLGVSPGGKEPLELLAEIPNSIAQANLAIAAIGLLSLIILFVLPLIQHRFAKVVPAPMVVLAVMIPLGLWLDLEHEHTLHSLGQIITVGPKYLVQLPGSLFSVITFPDFSTVFTGTSIKYIIMFALIGTIESTLSVLAIDAMDPRKYASNLNRDLMSVGLGNLICGFIGGLPMISEIVRSKANIDGGAHSKMSNFYHGLFLLIAVVVFPAILHEIPLAALAAMLVFVGTRLASPRELFHMKEIGKDQLFLFVSTMVTTLATDLLIGVAVGITLKLTLHKWRGASIRSLFYPNIEQSFIENTCNITLHEAATFSALLNLRKKITLLPSSVTKVVVDVSDVVLVDHTFLCRLSTMADEWPGVELELKGLDDMCSTSIHPFATRTKTA